MRRGRLRAWWPALALLGACAGSPVAGGAGAASDPRLSADSPYPSAARPLRPRSAPRVVTDASRDRSDEARRVAEILRIMPGQRIVELEAGDGYFALRFARALGPASPVTAVHTDPGDAAWLDRRAAELGLPWVRSSLSTDADPRLPPADADVAIISDGYAQIREPYAYFARLAPVLASGGRLALVALDADMQLGGMPLELARCELEAVGYELEMSYRLVPADRYLAVFRPPEEAAPPSQVRPCPSDGSLRGSTGGG